MTVAIVAPSLDVVGGQGVQARSLAERLRGEGYSVLFVPQDPRFPAGLRWLRSLPFARTALNQALYLPSLRALRRADVVQVFSASYWSFLLGPAPAILAARAFGRRVILNYHSGEASDHLARWGRLVHPFLKLVHEIVVPSDYLARVFAGWGYRAEVIPNCVDLMRFRYRERRPLGPRLISTRNLEPHYRVDNTIRAFRLLKETHPDATLTVVGCGSQEGRLRALTGGLQEAVRFEGRVEPEGMPRVYDDADIFVNSSVVDNQPLSVLEAFAAGLPVISTATGGLASMVRDGETGLVVPPDDPLAMSRAVSRLLDDAARARALARNAREEVEAYAWLRVRARWAELYEGRTA